MTDEIATLDPSALTTQQLLREIYSLEKLTTQRMDAIEKAVEVAHENLVRVPTDVDKAVGHLRDVLDEKIKRIDTQIRERDIRAEQSSRDSKVALDAALQSAEKMVAQQTLSSSQAIAKSEMATQKQMDQQSLSMISATSALGDKIDDIKDRLTRIEGEGRGLKAAETTQQTSNMSVVSIIGLVVGSLIGITGIIVAIISRSAT